jgi:hypothetical protein
MPLRKLTRAQINRSAQTTLERIYADVQKSWFRNHFYNCKYSSHIYRNPFKDWPNWSLRKRLRYRQTEVFLGRQFTAMVAQSPSFLASLARDCLLIYQELLSRIQNNRNSIRMFITTRIPFHTFYNSSPISRILGPIIPSSKPYPPASHPHELYLSLNYTIERCYFNNSKLMINIPETIYNPMNFNLSNIRHTLSTWPKEWPYPFDPTTPRRSTLVLKATDPKAPYPMSLCCGQPCDPELCKCQIWHLERNTLVEVVEYPNFETPRLPMLSAGSNSTSAAPCRGVRILQSMETGTVLAEYVGEIVPWNSGRWFGDEVYGMSLAAPPKIGPNGKADVLGELEGTADILAGWKGNWTRFINEAEEDRDNNVEFITAVWARKLRIVCRTTRAVEFGEELLTKYGDIYWDDVRGEKW